MTDGATPSQDLLEKLLFTLGFARPERLRELRAANPGAPTAELVEKLRALGELSAEQVAPRRPG